MMEKADKIKFGLFIVVLVIAGFILEKVYLTASSPSSVKVLVYKVELMKDASDTNPQMVFSNPDGRAVDLTENGSPLALQAQILPGTYKRVRMTVDNGLKLSIAKQEDNPCGGEIFTDSIIPEAEGMGPDSRVHMDFAAHDDHGGTWADSRITHVLLAPVTASENRPVQLNFRFKTANTLFCTDGEVKIRSPLAVWVETF